MTDEKIVSVTFVSHNSKNKSLKSEQMNFAFIIDLKILLSGVFFTGVKNDS